MIVMNDTAVGADGHINAGLTEIFVTGCADLDQSGCLTAADALGLTGDADRTAADTDLDKVSTAISKEAETSRINYVTCTDLYSITIILPYPLDGICLPAGITLGRVDNQNVRTGFQQSGNTGGIVPGVDTGTYQITLLVVQQFQRIFLMSMES